MLLRPIPAPESALGFRRDSLTQLSATWARPAHVAPCYRRAHSPTSNTSPMWCLFHRLYSIAQTRPHLQTSVKDVSRNFRFHEIRYD
jgi:hypothetical protein